MNVLIRVDASYQIGSGHVIRCLTLARCIRSHGGNVTFACRPLDGNLIEKILSENFEVKQINYSQSNFNVAADVSLVSELIKYLDVDVLVCDHYDINHFWEDKFKFISVLMVIDDLAEEEHHCDILLNQNYAKSFFEMYSRKKYCGTVMLLGLKYVLLQPEYIETRKNIVIKRSKKLNILVFFGGSDLHEMTKKTSEMMLNEYGNCVSLTVVVGAQNPRAAALKDYFIMYKNVSFYQDLPSLAPLMATADLMIGAGGTSLWERFYMGLPSIVFSTAFNQVEACKRLDSENLIFYQGSSQDIEDSRFINQVSSVMSNPDLLKSMSKKIQDVVDGKGPERTFKNIQCLLARKKEVTR
jgi:UDP-2,4-diacetamido-2,4,6-trideoxy-beta-L-altropyranose hydrolase